MYVGVGRLEERDAVLVVRMRGGDVCMYVCMYVTGESTMVRVASWWTGECRVCWCAGGGWLGGDKYICRERCGAMDGAAWEVWSTYIHTHCATYM